MKTDHAGLGVVWAEQLRVRARPFVHGLSVPHGYTLSVAGVLTTMVGHRGFPGLLSVWLFVLGGGLAYCAGVLAAGAHIVAAHSGAPLRGPELLHLTPVVVVPAGVGIVWWIKNDNLAFFLAGFAVFALYLCLLVALTSIFSARCPRSEPSNRSTTESRH